MKKKIRKKEKIKAAKEKIFFCEKQLLGWLHTENSIKKDIEKIKKEIKLYREQLKECRKSIETEKNHIRKHKRSLKKLELSE